MKLLSIALARSVWLANVNDLNPRGRNLYPLIHSFLLDTYKFKKYPKLNDEVDESKGIVFDNGEFKNEAEEHLSIKMTIFNYGIIADCAMRDHTVQPSLSAELFVSLLWFY